MKVDVQAEMHRLNGMNGPALKAKYLEVFGEASHSNNAQYLRKRIIWQIQANAMGGLSERAKRRAMELADETWLRTRAPRKPKADPGPEANAPHVVITGLRANPRPSSPSPGTVLVREYQGRRIVVSVLPKGFEHEGKVYRSLSAVANAVTGSHWNGALFFGLKQNKSAKSGRAT